MKDKVNGQLLKSAKTPKERSQLKESVIASLATLEITLMPLLKDKVSKSYKDIESLDIYDKPNALAFLADQHGYRRALKEVLKLIGDKRD